METKPVVKYRIGTRKFNPIQEEPFQRFISEGKRLFQEEMDFAGALWQFKEAEKVAANRRQKSEVYFFRSLIYYATMTDVYPGNHVVSLILEGYEEYEVTVLATAGDTAVVNAILIQIITGSEHPFLREWRGEGNGDGQFSRPQAIALSVLRLPFFSRRGTLNILLRSMTSIEIPYYKKIYGYRTA